MLHTINLCLKCIGTCCAWSVYACVWCIGQVLLLFLWRWLKQMACLVSSCFGRIALLLLHYHCTCMCLTQICPKAFVFLPFRHPSLLWPLGYTASCSSLSLSLLLLSLSQLTNRALSFLCSKQHYSDTEPESHNLCFHQLFISISFMLHLHWKLKMWATGFCSNVFSAKGSSLPWEIVPMHSTSLREQAMGWGWRRGISVV